MLSKPVVVVNVKTYPQATGDGALQLVHAAAQVKEQTGANIALAVQSADLRLVAGHGIPIFAQHVDARRPGAHTGFQLAPALAAAGAEGTLINHSERRLRLADIDAIIGIARQHDWTTIVCSNNVATTRAAAALGPHYVAVEPPELIGGDVSVTEADPDIVRESAKALEAIDPQVRLLCGAGVKTGKDVATAIELGADGVLLASGVAKAKDPQQALHDLVSRV